MEEHEKNTTRNRVDKKEENSISNTQDEQVNLSPNTDNYLSNGKPNILPSNKDESINDPAILYEQSKEEFKSALDFSTPTGIFTYIKIPAMFFAVGFFSYLVGRFNISIFFLIFILYSSYFVINRHLCRFERSMKALIFQQARKQQILHTKESVEWLNYLIEKIWKVLEPNISQQLFRTINPILVEKCPPFLSQLRLTHFTLGSQPPQILNIENITSQTKSDIENPIQDSTQDTIILDTNILFIPCEVSKDSLYYITKSPSFTWNSKIILVARVGKNISLDLPILAKEISFQAHARLIIKLQQELPLIDSIEFLFMNSPHIDFDLKPLKAVDLMDIPLLSNWINLAIKSSLDTLLVNPNSIKIDLKQLQIEKSYFIGVIKIHIHKFIGINDDMGRSGGDNRNNSSDTIKETNSTEDEIIGPVKIYPDRLSVNIGVDYRLLFRSKQKKYSKNENTLIFNEYFYFLIQNTDDHLNFDVRIGTNKIGSGNLNIKKVIEMERSVVYLKIKNNGKTIGIVDTMVEFYRTMDVGSEDDKKVEKEKRAMGRQGKNTNRFESAIITLKVLNVEDMLGLKTSRKKIYSSFCSFIVSDRQCTSSDTKKWVFNPFSLVTGTASALGNTLLNAGNALGGVLGNMIVSGNEEVDISGLGRATPYTFYSFETKHSVETNSPAFNQTYDFYARNLENDILFLRINELGTENVIGKIEIPLNKIKDNENCWYKLKEAESGRINLEFKIKPIENTTIKYFKNAFFNIFRDYKYFIKIEILNFSNVFLNGCYSLIVKNKFNIFYFNSFSFGNYKIEKIIYLPICDFSDFKVYFFKEVDISEEFVGEGTIVLQREGGSADTTDNRSRNSNNSDTKTSNTIPNSNTNDTIQNPNSNIDTTDNTPPISTSISIEKDDVKIADLNISWIISPLYDYKGHSENPSKFKVIQVRFKEFFNIGCDFYCEFMSDNYVLDRSVVSKNNILPGVYTLRVGSEEIRAIFRSADLGKNKILGECLIPKRVMNERVYLDEERFWVDCEIRVNTGEYEVLEMNCGWIKICIKTINLKTLIDPLFTVTKNGNIIFKSKVLGKSLNLICSEEIVMWVDGWSDNIRIDVFEYRLIERNRFIGFCEFEMNFLSKKERNLECKLIGSDGFTEQGKIELSIEAKESKF